MNFVLILQTCLKKQHCLGEKGAAKDAQNFRNAKCPKTFGHYCLLSKIVFVCHRLLMLVVYRVIDGADYDGGIKNFVSRLYDVISRATSLFDFFGTFIPLKWHKQ